MDRINGVLPVQGEVAMCLTGEAAEPEVVIMKAEVEEAAEAQEAPVAEALRVVQVPAAMVAWPGPGAEAGADMQARAEVAKPSI